MKQKSSILSLFPLFIAIVVTITVGCYEPTEGCIENWATNFDVLADNLCDDCCSAPDVNAVIKYYINDSTEYTFGDTIIHSSGRFYSILNMNTMLSNFEIGTGGEIVDEINDSVEIKNIFYDTDFGFSSGQGSNIAITEYQVPYAVDSITYVLGLIPEWQDTLIFGRDNADIARAVDSLYIISDDFYSNLNCFISLDTTDIDTLRLVSSLSDTVRYAFAVDDFQLSLGENTTLELRVDLFSWFDPIISVVDTEDASTLADNLVSSMADNLVIQ